MCFGRWRIRWTRFSRWFDGAAYNFSNCRNDMTIAREEVFFGPVLATIPFDTEDEAYDIANDSAYGLGAGIWTSDIGRAHEGLHVSKPVQFGSIPIGP